jgi:hypothetical protein
MEREERIEGLARAIRERARESASVGARNGGDNAGQETRLGCAKALCACEKPSGFSFVEQNYYVYLEKKKINIKHLRN